MFTDCFRNWKLLKNGLTATGAWAPVAVSFLDHTLFSSSSLPGKEGKEKSRQEGTDGTKNQAFLDFLIAENRR